MLSGAVIDRLTQSFADFPNSFRRDMEADGYTIIEPGDGTLESFSLKHWHMASFLARKGDDIFVPLIHARKPEHGALSRLCIEVHEKGLKLAVIAPLGPLKAILGNWNFVKGRGLICGSVEDIWREPVNSND